jgi:hypothetical protein
VAHRVLDTVICLWLRDYNNGFWIGWLDLLTAYFTISLNHNQIQQIAINLQPNPSSLIPRTHSILLLVLRLASETESESESESYFTTDGQSASLSWNKAPVCDLRPDFYYCQTVADLLMWGVLSDERTGMSFTISPGPRQRSHFWVLDLWDSWPCFTVWNSRLPFRHLQRLAALRWRSSTPPPNRRVTCSLLPLNHLSSDLRLDYL